MKKTLLFILLLFVSVGVALAQGKTNVTGKVLAEDNTPIAGATVVVKGDASIGTITDGKGAYALSVPKDAILEFSFMGYSTVDVPISGKTVVNVVLKEESLRVDDVVVTAMGISREKKTLGYASQELKSEELEKAKQTDLNNALVGKVSGVRFYGGSGAKFDEGSILLRGTSSLNANGGEPIYVVDGVITSVSAVSMEDVASLNVLKGPAATAVYGSRGGNGAVIIITKTGAKNKSQISLSHTLSLETVYLHQDYQNRYAGGNLGGNGALPAKDQLRTYKYATGDPAWMQAMDGARYYDMNVDESWGPEMDGTLYAPFYAWDPQSPRRGTLVPMVGQPDNIKDLYRTGVTNSTNVSFSKSGEGYMTRISLSNVARTGVQPNSTATRRFLSFKTAVDVSKRLKINLDYRLSYRQNKNAAKEGYSGTNASYGVTQWFNRNVDTNDLKDYKRPDGTFTTWNISSIYDQTSKYANNPHALFGELSTLENSTFNDFNVGAQFAILPNKLTASVNFMGNMKNSNYEYYKPIGLMGLAEYETNQRTTYDTQIQGRLSYTDKYLNDKITFEANAFVEQRDYSYRETESFARDGLSLPYFANTAASIGLPGGGNTLRKQQDQSVFALANISYNDTYFLEGSIRNDWTSTLPTANNSYLYGGLSASVLLHKFMPKATFLNFWKLRASIAQVGSTMSAYNVYETFIIGGKYDTMTSTYFDTNLKSLTIKPTISSSWEVGTEFRMLKNRLYGDFNFYMKDSKNQIVNISVTGATGNTSLKLNAGSIQNKGYEITLGGSPILTKNFEWSLTANFSQNNNTLKELYGDITELQQGSWSTSGAAQIWAVTGQPVGEIRSYTTLKHNGLPVLSRLKTATESAGTYAMTIDKTMSKVGNVQPDAVGGLSTSLRYKNFNFGATMDYQIGGNLISITNMYGDGSGLLNSTAGNNDNGVGIRAPLKNGGGVHVKGYEITGKDGSGNNIYKEVDTYIPGRAYYKSMIVGWDNYCYDASYVKLRELSLGYDFSKELLQKLKIGLTSARLSFVATNPWLIYSGVPNIDPSEMSGDRARDTSIMNAMERGQSFSTRTFGFSINLVF